jgi:hypothetical protein
MKFLIRQFITVFVRAQNWTKSWATLIQPEPFFLLICISLVFSHLCFGSSSGHFTTAMGPSRTSLFLEEKSAWEWGWPFLCNRSQFRVSVMLSNEPNWTVLIWERNLCYEMEAFTLHAKLNSE